MQITISCENCQISSPIEELLQGKIATELDKHLLSLSDDQKRAVVSISKEEYYFQVNFDLWLPNKQHIFAKEQDKDLVTAIYAVRDEVERQLEKYHELSVEQLLGTTSEE